jgi:hypothetical protein
VVPVLSQMNPIHAITTVSLNCVKRGDGYLCHPLKHITMQLSLHNIFTCKFIYTVAINVSDRLIFTKDRYVFLEVENKYSKILFR